MSNLKAPTVVIAAVIERSDLILVTQRVAGTHLAGYWEFPGGKLEDGETHQRCLKREIREELDASIVVETRLHSTTFTYPEHPVELHFYRCHLNDEPTPQFGQLLRWVSRSDLQKLKLPPADLELVELMTTSRRSQARTPNRP